MDCIFNMGGLCYRDWEEGGYMDCIYNTNGLCYRDWEDIKECQYIGAETECEDAMES